MKKRRRKGRRRLSGREGSGEKGGEREYHYILRVVSMKYTEPIKS